MDAMVERAILLATHAHLGQVDKLGEPYILHPLRVMLAVPPVPKLRALAVSHDTLEDTSLTAQDFLQEGFGQDFIDSLVALTRNDGEDYLDFVRRAAADPDSCVVKEFDIRDNMMPSRMLRLDQDTRNRLYLKYDAALAVLQDL